MSHPLSTLGVIHTAVSLIPVLSGLYAFIRHRAIDPATRAGCTWLGWCCRWPPRSPCPARAGSTRPRIRGDRAAGGIRRAGRAAALAGRAARYLSTFALSFSFLLSLVPGVNETLTRLPAAHPIAAAPMAPVVLQTLLACLVVFVIGFAAQCWRLRNRALAGRS
jgi:hypothetical protein